MAASLSTIAAKDGAGTTIPGALNALDKSGANTGPFVMAHILLDGAAGVNRANVDTHGSAQITPVTSGGTAFDTGSGTGGTGTQRVIIDSSQLGSDPTKAEDTASANADVGIPAMVLQQTTPADTANADGDYTFLQIKNGKLWVQNVGFATTCSTDITRPADTAAYTANDALADSTSAPTAGGFTLTNAARISGGSGVIVDIVVISSNDPATLLQGELWMFNQAVTAVNDNAAFALSDSDAKNLVAVVPFTLATTTAGSGTNSFAHLQGLNIAFTASGSANLRYLVKVKNAYTPASGEVLTVVAKIVQTN